MMPLRILRALAAGLLLGLIVPASAWAGPNVVTTILPLHSLTAAVMQGVAEPHLLVRGGSSPHGYALRPSDVKALADADVVIWIGEELETFMKGAIDSVAGKADVVTLFDAPGMRHLPVREGGAWEGHEHAGHQDAGHMRDHAGEHGHAEEDPHLWLDTDNAAAIVEAVAKALISADPAHAGIYRGNADALHRRLRALAGELDGQLAGLRGRPYIVFHDAYQYFERQFGLTVVGSVTLSPDRRPGARRLSELRSRIVAAGAVCVFAEPQFEPRLVDTLVEGTGTRKGILDPLGIGLTPGPDAYFQLMRGLATALGDCLSG